VLRYVRSAIRTRSFAKLTYEGQEISLFWVPGRRYVFMTRGAFAQSNDFALNPAGNGSITPFEIPDTTGVPHCGTYSLSLPFTVNPLGNLIDDLKGGPNQSVQVLVGSMPDTVHAG